MSILVFGDSIGQGAFDPTYNGWVSLLAAHQWKKILDTEGEEGHEVFNVSVSGDTTEDLLRRIESDVKTRGESKKGKIAVLAIGTNDAATVNGVYQVDFDQYKKISTRYSIPLNKIANKSLLLVFHQFLKKKVVRGVLTRLLLGRMLISIGMSHIR